MGESETTSDGRYYISDYFMTEYQPLPYPTLFYTAAYADEWAPNGETEWHGYPIQQISQDVLDAFLAQARAEAVPQHSASSALGAPLPELEAKLEDKFLMQKSADPDEVFQSKVVMALLFSAIVAVAAVLISMRKVWKQPKR
jgi:hypothetical protein